MSIVPSELPINITDNWFAQERKRGWNDCRAQMLRNLEKAHNPVAWRSDHEPLYLYPIELAGVPEGWKLVPLEETDAMLEAADTAEDHNVCCMTCASVAYRTMVAAAPPAPAYSEIGEVVYETRNSYGGEWVKTDLTAYEMVSIMRPKDARKLYAIPASPEAKETK